MGHRFEGSRFIGRVAADLGVNPRTLRYYESIGLLPAPGRTSSGYRVYDGRAAQRIGFITRAKGLGLTLKEIREILTIFDRGKTPCRTVQQVLQKHLGQVEVQIGRLRALRAELRAFLADWPVTCETNGTAVCPRIENDRADSRDGNPSVKRGGFDGEDRVAVSRLRSVPDR